tara:strand:+ start:549 stop:1043 length:495 start_codon:yes stop_codon:yes gene_type:complete
MKLPTDSTPTFYDSKEGTVNTVCLCDSFENLKDETKVAWVKENKKEYQAKHPELELISFSKALELSQQADRKKYKAGIVKEITEERFDEMLNVLPPDNWINYSTNESFRICEDLTGELSNFYIRVFDGEFPNHKERFFTVVMPRDTQHNRLISMAARQHEMEVK